MIQEVEGLRGIRMLIVLGAITAAGYIVYRVRTQRWSRGPVGASIPTARFEPARFASEAPAEDVAMVAPVDGTPPTAVMRPESNGTATPVLGADSPPAPASALGPIELPPKRRLSGTTLAAVAALLGVAAIALGTTALVKSLDSDDAAEAVEQTSTVSAADEVISLLSKPSTQRMPVANSGGRIVLAIGANGRGVLILDGLGAPPPGKAYQAWVIKPKAKAPLSAGLFSGIETIVPLSVSVKAGSVVAITIERAGGAPAPTQAPTLVAQPAT
ncbi:MAG: anti-sigma factor [Thermoleophilaceae bacterium]|nr:anti-sigma factor [Thermoleophilaceae bacterium]